MPGMGFLCEIQEGLRNSGIVGDKVPIVFRKSEKLADLCRIAKDFPICCYTLGVSWGPYVQCISPYDDAKLVNFLHFSKSHFSGLR